MANLSETPDYPAGVYQLETSDPVLGGPGGIANRQAEQLANRTSWLKAKVDAFIDGTVAVLKATKLATPRTLSISGAGSGSASFDGGANANIALTLADSGAVAGTYPKVTVNAKGIVTGGAALAAGDIPTNLALTGAPSAPTAPVGANTTQLANTAFVQVALAALVDSSPTALNTLNELALALGDDPNFAATMATALGLKAPLASPAFTGNPTAPTPGQFDNDASLASTEFVQRALGNMAGQVSKNTSSTLPASEAGNLINLIAGALVTTLPPLSSVPVGATFKFICTGQAGAVVQRNGADSMSANGSLQTSFTLGLGDTLEVMAGSAALWFVIGGTVQLKYSAGIASSLGASGWKKYPDPSSPTGYMIKQWGAVTVTGGAFSTWTFPVAFPNAVLHRSAAWSAGAYSSAQKAGVIFGSPVLASTPVGVTDSSGTYSLMVSAEGY